MTVDTWRVCTAARRLEGAERCVGSSAAAAVRNSMENSPRRQAGRQQQRGEECPPMTSRPRKGNSRRARLSRQAHSNSTPQGQATQTPTPGRHTARQRSRVPSGSALGPLPSTLGLREGRGFGRARENGRGGNSRRCGIIIYYFRPRFKKNSSRLARATRSDGTHRRRGESRDTRSASRFVVECMRAPFAKMPRLLCVCRSAAAPRKMPERAPPRGHGMGHGVPRLLHVTSVASDQADSTQLGQCGQICRRLLSGACL